MYMHFHNQNLKPRDDLFYEQRHKDCKKYMAYFTSRFGILYNTSNNRQTFYQGHSVKISTIAKHPT